MSDGDAMAMTVGAQLASARRERQLSVSNVTRQTKIQPWVVEALEADRLQELMSPVYARGFVAMYARFLGLPPEPLREQLTWPAPEPAQEPAAQSPPAIPITVRWPTLTGLRARRLAPVVAGVALVAGLALATSLRRLPNRSATTLSSAKVARSTVHQGLTARPKPVTQQGVKGSPAKPAASAEPATPQRVAKAVPPREPSSPAHTALPAPSVSAASVAPVSPSLPPATPPTLTLLATQPLELSVVAHRTTWITVRSDGKLLTQQRLPRGATERWSAKKTLELVVSKPTQAEFALNGHAISPFVIAHEGRVLITHHGITRLPLED